MKQAEIAFTETDIQVVAQTLETYVFRNFTICGRQSNKSEAFLSSIARDVYGGNIDTATMICSKIKGETVADQEFSDAFDVWSGSKSTKEIVRYILRKIHAYIDINMEIDSDSSNVHIEHIMPESNEHWHVSEEIHDTYLWRLGNLALLSGPLNRSASNKVFDEKKQLYSSSKIEPNKAIANYAQWTSAEIEHRQKQLRSYALCIWKK